MIGKSFPELVFIRLAIACIRLVTPLSIAYLAADCYIGRILVSPVLALYALAEALFYSAVFCPRRIRMQKAAAHPPPMSRTERKELFDKCAQMMTAQSTEGWFSQSSLSRIQQGNVIEWLLWALFSTDAGHNLGEWEEELNSYISVFATIVGYPLDTGSNGELKTMRLTLDPVVMIHRPLIWYMIVALVDTITSVSLYCRGFNHFNTQTWLHVFPPRPLLSLISNTSTKPDIPYWYRPHRSSSKLPILFIHGIGIGVWPYLSFFSDVIKQDPDVGILVLEILPISMRITSPPLDREAMCSAIQQILDTHSLPRVVVVSHSYGTVITAHLFKSQELSSRIAATLFVDPIPFLLHHPSVAYNFVYRAPRDANEWQLWFFASRDPDIARALSRHFFWFESVLWKEELEGKRVVVSLAEKDQIVDTGAVRKYLTGEDVIHTRWKKDGLEVLFHHDLDHASVFDAKDRWTTLVEVLHRLVRE